MVHALSRREAHVPFRQSRLTALLKDALTTSGHTTVLTHITPVPACADEAVAALRFAAKLRTVATGSKGPRIAVPDAAPSARAWPGLQLAPVPRPAAQYAGASAAVSATKAANSAAAPAPGTKSGSVATAGKLAAAATPASAASKAQGVGEVDRSAGFGVGEAPAGAAPGHISTHMNAAGAPTGAAAGELRGTQRLPEALKAAPALAPDSSALGTGGVHLRCLLWCPW